MAISEETRRELFKRAKGQCECTMSVCSHHRAGQRCHVDYIQVAGRLIIGGRAAKIL